MTDYRTKFQQALEVVGSVTDELKSEADSRKWPSAEGFKYAYARIQEAVQDIAGESWEEKYQSLVASLNSVALAMEIEITESSGGDYHLVLNKVEDILKQLGEPELQRFDRLGALVGSSKIEK